MLPSCACGSGDATCTLAPVLGAKQSLSTNGAETAPVIVPPTKQQPVIAIGAVPPALTAQLSNRDSLQLTVCAGLVATVTLPFLQRQFARVIGCPAAPPAPSSTSPELARSWTSPNQASPG
jgi:hypothetical protein